MLKMLNDCRMTSESEKGFDPGFKLFGKTMAVSCCPFEKDEESSDTKQVLQSSPRELPKEESPEGEEEVRSSDRKDGDDENEVKNGEKAALKKPDKLLPCPRCESMDTKFCYYNNYNVNQPRHFCKNCQRYWTAGGSLRNVPVGAGRRKNKHSAAATSVAASHYRQIRAASESAAAAAAAVAALGVRTDDHDGVMIHSPPLKVAGSRIQAASLDILDSTAPTVLTFGPESSAHKIPCSGENERMDWRKKQQQQSRDEIISVTTEREAAAAAATAAGRMDPPSQPQWPNGTVPGAGACSGAPPFFAGPWSYGWNFAAPGPWGPMSWPLVSGFPFAGWAGGPWVSAPSPVSAAASTCKNPSDCGSPTLGKRPQCEGAKTADGCVWVPKTLRIDDPGEAAKSSIWATLGLSNKMESSVSGGRMFTAFRPNTEVSNNSPKKPEPDLQVLRANPAAFSRSISFQESN